MERSQKTNSKNEYYNHFLEKSKQNNDPALYYKMISRLKEAKTPPAFSVTDLFTDCTDAEAAEKTADYFTKISDGFTPLDECDIPASNEEDTYIELTENQVLDRVRTCKKPKGLLPGDLFPDMLVKYADVIARPLTNVLNAAFKQEMWPMQWRTETVTTIPECNKPDGLGDTRNISCMPVFSKIIEYFLLERLKQEASVCDNQFGGIQGSSTNHYLAAAWTDILEALDQDGGVANLLSVDFAKAFNTMEHQACIKAMTDHGASRHTVRMAAAFLMKRQMIFKAGQATSTPRLLKGGAPQGTLIGNYLFIMTTDQLELEHRTQRTNRALLDLQKLTDRRLHLIRSS